MQTLRKLTIKAIVGDIADQLEDLIKAKGKTIWLCDIYGITARARSGSTAMGEYVKFAGTFQATNLLTGEEFESVSCIIPTFLGEAIYSAMTINSEEGKLNTARFAFRFGAHYDKTAIAKYVFDVQSLLPPSSNDEMAQLRAQARAALPSASVTQLEDKGAPAGEDKKPQEGTQEPAQAPTGKGARGRGGK